MSSESPSNLELAIGHVVTMDIVGYSKLLIHEQSEQLQRLNEIVRGTNQFRAADGQGTLVRLPTGDGMVLVFFKGPEAPIECAIEIAAALKNHPAIQLRMGIHSGPINEVLDVNERTNVAGAGIDIAQRVMDCGDAGHILLSKRVADDLAPYLRWSSHLHDLGECETKHGRRISLVNFYTEEIGNPEPPRKCQQAQSSGLPGAASSVVHRRKRSLLIAAALGVTLLALAALIFLGTDLFSSWRHLAAAETGHSIVVLPFENATNDPNAEYLSEGISEALINSLTELQQLRVIARSTAFHYKGKNVDPRQIGHDLHVAAVLTGRVRQMQDALSVQVDLVDAATGAQLWGAAYDRKVSDVVAVKQAIAREVTQKLKLKLSGEEERRLIKRDTTNAEAYQFYLRGRYFWNRRTPEGLTKAIAQFQQAIEHDPNFAPGYAGLADAWLLVQQYVGVPSREAMPKARAAADRALQLDDSLAEAHASSALAYQFMWQWPESEQEYRRAISSNDNYATAHHWFGTYFLVLGQLDDALRELKRAQELDPLSQIISANFAIISLLKNDTAAAIDQAQKIIAFDSNHIIGHDWLGWAYLQAGRLPEAITEREKVVELSQRASPHLSGLGHVYAVAGRRKESLDLLRVLEERYAKGDGTGQGPAAICAGLGDFDQAFAWLEKDFRQKSAELQFITWRVQFRELRRDPRYANLIRRMGINPQIDSLIR